MMRVNLSVAIVDMAKYTGRKEIDSSSSYVANQSGKGINIDTDHCPNDDSQSHDDQVNRFSVTNVFTFYRLNSSNRAVSLTGIVNDKA